MAGMEGEAGRGASGRVDGRSARGLSLARPAVKRDHPNKGNKGRARFRRLHSFIHTLLNTAL